MTRVSVIMPVYNSHQWIYEAVNSVLTQDHPDLELILVDDGSTDPDTRHFLDNLPWSEVKLLRQENKGQAAARNSGIQAATGEYILPLDSDDYIAPSYASLAASILDMNPDIGIVYCRAELMGDAEGEWKLPPYSLKLMLTQGLIFVTSMFRKQDWAAVQGFDETLHMSEDHDFWLRIIGLGRGVHRIDKFLFKYRIRQKSVNNTKTRGDYTEAYAQIIRNNSELFIRNADIWVESWRETNEELNMYKHKYRHLEYLINKYPWAYESLRRAKQLIKR